MEFNENPFQKDTPVTPFSNGTEGMMWHERNCQNCRHYESESTTEETAKCKLAFNVDLGFVSGEIPLWVAKEIGCEYNPLYQSVSLNLVCRKLSNDTIPF